MILAGDAVSADIFKSIYINYYTFKNETPHLSYEVGVSL